MTIEKLKELKDSNGLTNKKIAELSGVPYSTVAKIFSGATSNPRLDKLKAIEKSIVDFIKDDSGSFDTANILNKGHTIKDYYALPEDKRVELIDGAFYDMSSPTVWHQRVTGYVYAELYSYIKSKGGKCLPLLSPLDVQLDCDDKTIVQPDVVIVCDPNKVKENVIFGVPDWIMEVVSPSTKKRDYCLKLEKYQNAGVREYWIVDRKQERVIAYSHMDSDEDMQISIYTFQDKIPVGIYNDLLIDMSEITTF